MKRNIKYSLIMLMGLLFIGCGGGDSSKGTTSSFTATDNAPKITSEKSYKVQEGDIYVGKIEATDQNSVTYFLKGEDKKYFMIDGYSGEITFIERPSFKNKSIYNIIGVARDVLGNEREQDITITIEEINDDQKDTIAPVFKTDSQLVINKNKTNQTRIVASDTSEVVYTISGKNLDDFYFDSSTGILRARDLTKVSYTFKVVAKDSAGNSTSQIINIQVENQKPSTPSPSDESRDTTSPVFSSPNSVVVALSTQLDYSMAPSVLNISATDESFVRYYMSGTDSNSFYIADNQLYFAPNAIPLQKSTYSVTLFATDDFGNQSSQDVTISINDDVGDSTPPQFLSSASSTVPVSEQSDYTTAPEVLFYQTDKDAGFSLEGADSNSFYLYTDETNRAGGIYFTYEAIPLQKTSYSFILVAVDNTGNISRQNITINIDGDITVDPTPSPAPSPDEPNPDDILIGAFMTEWVTGAYENDVDMSENLFIPYAERLSVHIEGQVEQDYDFVLIYDSEGNLVTTLSGVINETLVVDGNEIKARLISDSTETDIGVKVDITSISTDTPPDTPPTTNDDQVTKWITGEYDNNVDMVEKLYLPSAEDLSVHIVGETEENYDFILIYNSENQLVASFSGNIDETINVDGSEIYAKLISDGSQTASGVTVEISATTGVPALTSVDISGYWVDEYGDVLFQFKDNNIWETKTYDSEQNCYTLEEIEYARIGLNRIKDTFSDGSSYTFDILRNGSVLNLDGIMNFNEITSDQFNSVPICE